jgi:hypothetical protein
LRSGSQEPETAEIEYCLTSIEPDEQRCVGVAGEVRKHPVEQIPAVGLVHVDVTRPRLEVGAGREKRKVVHLWEGRKRRERSDTDSMRSHALPNVLI